MYRLPKDFDGSFFIEKRLEQVCITENQITFHFEGDISISSLSEFIHWDPNGSKKGFIVPIMQCDFLNLIGRSVAEWSSDLDGTLQLTFEGTHRLEFLDTSEQYESYEICFDDKTIIV